MKTLALLISLSLLGGIAHAQDGQLENRPQAGSTQLQGGALTRVPNASTKTGVSSESVNCCGGPVAEGNAHDAPPSATAAEDAARAAGGQQKAE